MLYKETVAITADELAWINSMLADCSVKDREEDPCCLDCKRKDFQTWSKTTVFPDGVEMDIKLCPGCTPWTEAVLFWNGSECGCTDPGDEFLSDWVLDLDGNQYMVEVVKESGNG